MGQQHSRTPRNRSLSRTLSLKDRSFHKFHKTKSKTLSAAFNVLDNDLNWELLNVNIATEEELMTLPGVNRTLAHSIVQYRQTIGGFKKVEDLALVSGIGATKLELFRSEVTVSMKRKNCESKSPSENQSVDSLPISDNGSFRQPSGKLVNINTANVFQLMTVRGICQELAANVIDYRDQKGPFNTLNDLLKVKTMTNARFSAIRPYLLVDMQKGCHERPCSRFNGGVANGLEKKSHHRRSKSVPLNQVPSSDTFLQEVFGILSRQSHRPIIEDIFRNVRKGRQAMRFAVWNLQDFSIEKSRNPGVQEVICRTILENGFSLVVVHEVSCFEALNSLVCELNDPLLPKTSMWDGERGKWHAWLPSADSVREEQMKTSTGFLYNSHHGLQIKDSVVFNEAAGAIHVAHLQIHKFQFLLANSYLLDTDKSSVHSAVNRIKEQFPESSSMLVFENSKLTNSVKGFCPTELHGFKEIIPYGTATVASNRSQCVRIWISNALEEHFTGHWGVVRDGLSHLAIPKGWTWGGSVSCHLPVWLELYTDTRCTPASIRSAHQMQNGFPSQPTAL